MNQFRAFMTILALLVVLLETFDVWATSPFYSVTVKGQGASRSVTSAIKPAVRNDASRKNGMADASNAGTAEGHYAEALKYRCPFPASRMPLKVHVASGQYVVQGWTPGHNEAVMNAFRDWEAASQGKIRFVEARYKGAADIQVEWKDLVLDRFAQPEARTLGRTFPECRGPQGGTKGHMVKAIIKMSTHFPNSNVVLPPEAIQVIALHEVGHALGMVGGHSPDKGDVMYYAENGQQRLTSRDIATLQVLYGE